MVGVGFGAYLGIEISSTRLPPPKSQDNRLVLGFSGIRGRSSEMESMGSVRADNCSKGNTSGLGIPPPRLIIPGIAAYLTH